MTDPLTHLSPQISQDARGWHLEAPGYRLHLPAERPFALLEDAEGQPWAELFLAPSLHALEGLDTTARIEAPRVRREGGGAVVELELLGSRWRRKVLVLECFAHHLRAYVRLEGQGRLTDAHYFGGYYSGHLRWGSGFFASGTRWGGVFNPEPYASERRLLPAFEPTAIDVMGTSLPGKGHWFFTPAPFYYAFTKSAPQAGALTPGALGADQGGTPVPAAGAAAPQAPQTPAPEGRWLGAGLEAAPAQRNFTAFHYDAGEGAFSFRLAYEGYTEVRGAFETPALLLAFTPDPYAGLAEYVGRLGLPAPAHPKAGWWLEPIQCGWGAQCSLANRQGGRAPDLCTQANYDGFLRALEAEGLRPGTLVIDDKWSASYGTCAVDRAKWPDLEGWIAARQAQGQRVLLWWKAWDPEGLDPEECVRDGLGQPVAADPSNPRYEATLRQAVRRMLLEYGADGFKVDFSARTPSGPGLRRHGPEWGVGLLHKLLWILYDEAKRCKPDALVMTHTPNPYFSDVTDMIRLNDVNTGADVLAQMVHRAKVARAACPHLLIDTDNWPMPSLGAWREYTRLQPELGIPSLYFATHVDSGEALTPEDYALVRAAWARHRKGTKA